MATVDNGETLQGQALDRKTGIVTPFTETMMHDQNAIAEAIGDLQTEVEPNDAHSSRVRVWGTPSNYASIYVSFPGTVNLNLPNVLTGVTATFNKDFGNGVAYREIETGVWIGSSGSASVTPNASCTASASIVPDVQVDITQTWAQNVPTANYLFYLPGNPTTADIISQLETILTLAVSSVVAGVVTTSTVHGLSLNQPFKFLTVVSGSGGIAVATTYYVKTIPTSTTFTYSATAGGVALNGHAATSGTATPVIATWPQFKPKAHTLTLKGGKASIQSAVELLWQYSWSSSGLSYVASPTGTADMYSASKDVSTNIRSVDIPPTIHAEITITGATDTQDISALAETSIPAITGTGGAPNWSAESNSHEEEATVNASVSPTTLAATTGYTAIPTAGLFIYDSACEPFLYQLVAIRVILVNFNAFA